MLARSPLGGGAEGGDINNIVAKQTKSPKNNDAVLGLQIYMHTLR